MTAEQTSYPVDHLSYSSLTQFLRNRFLFKKKYILKIYDDKTGPSAVVGKAGHKALQHFYETGNVDQAMQVGLELIDKTKDEWIDYGKTGSREKIIKTFTSAFTFYMSEAPKYKEIVGIEKSITAFVDIGEGKQLALPVKAISDLIVMNNGIPRIIDHKFVSSYSDGETDKALYMIQALFNYYTVKSEYGVAPDQMVFNECKMSKNTDGSPQIQPYVVDFSKHKNYFTVFHNLLNQVTAEISNPDTQYLPNFNDMFDGEETFKDYVAQIVTVESPIVRHKTVEREYAEPKYVASKVDIVDNSFLEPEEKIRLKFQEFGMAVEMHNTYKGASVVQYTLKPSRGIKMSKFEAHSNDIALALEAKYVRIEAPIPGTSLVGIEVPNPNRTPVVYDEVLGSQLRSSELDIPIGIDVHGKTVIKSLEDMPHLLIAGATGSGKSVMINVAIKAITDANSPETLKLVLIDPKRVELSQFKNLPHLMAPVIFDESKSLLTLNWLVQEMEVRYSNLEAGGYRNIREYNNANLVKMPRIVVVIDEYGDLIMASNDNKKELMGIDTFGQKVNMNSERAIVRLAQKARAIGIHLILGTQRPSVDVVTGLIKANLSCRIAFATASAVDSKVILDQSGADQLIGKGDMLFLDPHVRGLQRLQGFLI